MEKLSTGEIIALGILLACLVVNGARIMWPNNDKANLEAARRLVHETKQKIGTSHGNYLSAGGTREQRDGTVLVEGRSIPTRYGYPRHDVVDGLAALLKLPATDISVSEHQTTVFVKHGPSVCAIAYRHPAESSVGPVLAQSFGGC